MSHGAPPTPPTPSTPVAPSSASVAPSAESLRTIASADGASFDGAELAVVLSRYDIGVINSIHRFRRGSESSPKVLVRAARGDFILKRRAPERVDASRVRFSHRVQMHLADRRFPLPRLVRSRLDGATLINLDDRLYEMFEYIHGEKYDQSLATTASAGQALANLHLALADFPPGEEPAGSTYHNADGVRANLEALDQQLGADHHATIETLREQYEDAALRAEERGLSQWPVQVIHGDWHAGNMLFRNGEVVAVIDYDTVRAAPRVIDVANGALQFSLQRGDQGNADPASWPAAPDEARLRKFCRGYDGVQGCIISTAELHAMPWLMVEALLAEATGPVATTGRFGGIDGGSFLRMIATKSDWIRKNGDLLTRSLA